MSSKDDESYDEADDDDEDDEADFTPGVDDDADELDDDFEEVELDEEEGDNLLQGDLYMDNRKIAYDDSRERQCFRFCSLTDAPSSWSLQQPELERGHIFVGSILGSDDIQIYLSITKRKHLDPIGPFEKRFLDKQEEVQQQLEGNVESKPPGRFKGGDENSESDDDGKKVASIASNIKSESWLSDVYILEASQVTPDADGTTREIRGLFHAARKASSRIFIMATIQQKEACNNTNASIATVGHAAAAAPNKDRHGEDLGEGANFDYQELIDLHSDAGLSTEELKRKYYGGSMHSGSESKKSKY